MSKPESPIGVAILGATGAVGQRFVQLLDQHPWFRLEALVASERSAGKAYAEAVRWHLPGDIPQSAAAMAVLSPGAALSARIVFSGLDSGPATELEPMYAARGHVVVSNASAFRTDPAVPLLIPEINPGDLELIVNQPWAASGGALVTNPNCCVVGLAMALAPLQRTFGIEAVTVVTMQALSGAGYPGVASLDGLSNVIPFITGEEEKLAAEPLRILGADFPISVAVNRVPVRDGHMESVFVRLRRRASVDQVTAAMQEFVGEPQRLGLPSAPARPLVVIAARDRPQPLRDIDRDNGMAVTVGNLRADEVYDIKFTLLVHNTIRGAAGAALLNAELMVANW
jgi:aspartate-semialdehyde dehydrogenase